MNFHKLDNRRNFVLQLCMNINYNPFLLCLSHSSPY